MTFSLITLNKEVTKTMASALAAGIINSTFLVSFVLTNIL